MKGKLTWILHFPHCRRLRRRRSRAHSHAHSLRSFACSFARAQSSGVAVSPDCLEAFQQLKLGKKLKYIIYTLSPDNRQIVVGKTSTSDSYDEFLAELPPAECRYAIYDFEYEKGDDGKRSKICFFTW